MTLQDTYAAYLLKLGCREQSTRSGKYRIFVTPFKDIYYFLGKNGAVRWSKTSAVSQSHPVNAGLKCRMLQGGKI